MHENSFRRANRFPAGTAPSDKDKPRPPDPRPRPKPAPKPPPVPDPPPMPEPEPLTQPPIQRLQLVRFWNVQEPPSKQEPPANPAKTTAATGRVFGGKRAHA